QALPVEAIEPAWLVDGRDYARAELPSGGLIAVPNRLNQLFTVRYRFEIGARQEPLLCHALALLERAGAGDLDAEARVRDLYAMGTSIDTSCDSDETILTVSGVDRNLEPSIALLERWLREPRFDDATLAALVANTVSRRRDEVAD